MVSTSYLKIGSTRQTPSPAATFAAASLSLSAEGGVRVLFLRRLLGIVSATLMSADCWKETEMPTNRTAGFTLIELMITVVILSIIVGIAYPSYTQWMVQTRRSDAQIALTHAANQQERFFTECNTYAGSLTAARNCAAGGLGYPDADSPDDHYDLTLAALNVAGTCSALTSCFLITAAPKATGLQAGDGAFRIDSMGVKQWNRKNLGTWVKWTEK